ncbi:thioredoxin family protein [Phyllobacteriaceae bacterium JZ32]
MKRAPITTRGVVELFTSQGCNSCPPADALLSDLAKRNDVVALAFHVDYWDYLGWRDTLASPENTGRQTAYRNAMKGSMIYTPQVILNGRVQVNGNDAAGIRAGLARMSDGPGGLTVPVSITRPDDKRIVIEAGAGPKPSTPVHLIIAYFDDAAIVPIRGGENNGRSIVYRNAVRDIETIGMWDGKPLRVEIPASELAKKKASGCAVLLQEVSGDDRLGPIWGASMLKPHDLPVIDR